MHVDTQIWNLGKLTPILGLVLISFACFNLIDMIT